VVFLGLFWPGLKNFNKLKGLAKDKHSGVFVLWVSDGNGYLHLYCLNYISCSFSSLTFHCRLLARMSVRRRMSRSVPRQRDASLQERRLRSFCRIAQPGDGVSNTFWHNVLTYYVFFLDLFLSSTRQMNCNGIYSKGMDKNKARWPSKWSLSFFPTLRAEVSPTFTHLCRARLIWDKCPCSVNYIT